MLRRSDRDEPLIHHKDTKQKKTQCNREGDILIVVLCKVFLIFVLVLREVSLSSSFTTNTITAHAAPQSNDTYLPRESTRHECGRYSQQRSSRREGQLPWDRRACPRLSWLEVRV